MIRKIIKNLLVFSLLIGGLFVANFVFAQGLGLNAVNNGLGGSLTSVDPRILLGRIVNIALGFLGVIAVGFIAYAGFIWLTSNGNEEKIETAKKILKNGIIGLVIILASWGIATFLISKLGGAMNGGNGGNNGNGNGNGFGTCVGTDCTGGGGGGVPNNCATNPNPNCQASSGHPVIQIISPAGGFCTNNLDKSCSTNSQCSSGSCNLVTPNGTVDNFITISGQNFGTYSATSSKVVFVGQGKPVLANQVNNLNPACVNSWKTNQIIIAVPKGATTGPLKVINQNGSSDLSNDSYGPKIPDFQVNKILRPGLCQLSPSQGTLSSSVGYLGVNLHSASAYFGNYQNNIQALQSSFLSPAGLTGSSTIPNIKTGISSSFVQTKINGSLEKSNYLLFTKQAEPGSGAFISSFSPTTGNTGQYITIQGSGFGQQRGKTQVYFGKVEASYNFPTVCLNSVWTNNQIIVKVPTGLANGSYPISINLGKDIINTNILNPRAFKFDKNSALQTSLCKIDPQNGPVGTPVTLWGEYFGAVNSNGLVKFNPNENATGTIQQSGQADLIKTKVPNKALTGPVKVVKNSAWGNTLNFNIGSCTINSDCSGTQVCCAQNTYQHGRCVNTLQDCLINIPTSVFEWSFNTGFGIISPPPPPPSDPCTAFTNLNACQANTGCCFDAEATGGAKCRSGSQITGSSDKGYCAYYNCSLANPSQCATSTPVKKGNYKTLDVCNNRCPVQPACGSFTTLNDCQADTRCCFDSQATGGAKCRSGNQIIDSAVSTNNGYCAYYSCKLPPPATNSDLCATSTPSATGTYSNVSSCLLKCNSTSTSSTIVRPKIVSTSPKHLAVNVCRNTLVKINFNQRLDSSSYAQNFLLLEAKDYKNGVCPSGTFLVTNNSLISELNSDPQTWWQKVEQRFRRTLAFLTGNLSSSVFAAGPNSNSLYCSIPGMVYNENHGQNSSLVFRPKKILDPTATYYVVVKGDESLNNKTGILNFKDIGFVGPGYFNPTTATYISGKLIRFNNNYYANSQIIKFSTLSAQGPMNGICAVNHVTLTPSSYLFNTTNNALQSQENDANAALSNSSFDTVADSDKVFTATAYSIDKQILQPVIGYNWTWKFSLDNTVPRIATISSVPNLPANEVFVRANPGITDAQTKLTATVDMNNFISPKCTSDCNTYSGGNGFNTSANIYVFICNNPWPPVNLVSGTWAPWTDTSQGTNSANYNYQFYYCRDQGSSGTSDNLPALNSQPLTLGRSATLVCSSNHQTCQTVGEACGSNNSNGQQTGICTWGLLKQSYFFRAPILSGATITNASDQLTGGLIKLNWQSNANKVYSYKIYYSSPSQGATSSQEVLATKVCQLGVKTNNCQTSIGGLSNGVSYNFQISVISTDKTESALSPVVTAIPSDQTPPSVPTNLQAIISPTSTIKFSWATSTNGVSFYRLYHGIISGKYGESFDSQASSTSLSLPTNKFSLGNNYFTVSAFDSSHNESIQSGELTCVMSLDSAYPSSTVWTKLKCTP